jgi:hypothetical protein
VSLAGTQKSGSGGTLVPGGSPPLVVVYTVTASGTIVNNTTALVATTAGTTVSGKTTDGKPFDVTIHTESIGILPGQSATFTGEGTVEGAPGPVTSVDPFLWRAGGRCGPPPVQITS